MKKSREIAFLGIISALSVVFLLLGAIVEVLDITSAILASLMLLIAYEELKGKSVLVYLATAVISFFFVFFSSPMPAIEYTIFGLYPLIKPLIEKTPKVITYILKGVYIILASLGSAAVMYLLVPSLAEKLYMFAIYILVFALVIILFDLLIVRFKRYYQFKLRSTLRIDRFFK